MQDTSCCKCLLPLQIRRGEHFWARYSWFHFYPETDESVELNCCRQEQNQIPRILSVTYRKLWTRNKLELPSIPNTISALFDTKEVVLLHEDKWLCSQKSLHISSGNYGCTWTELLTRVHLTNLVTEGPKSGTIYCVPQSPSFCPQRYSGHILIQEVGSCLEIAHINGNVQIPKQVSCIDSSQSLLLIIVKIEPGVTTQELRALFLPETTELCCKPNVGKIRSQSDYSLWKQI